MLSLGGCQSLKKKHVKMMFIPQKKIYIKFKQTNNQSIYLGFRPGGKNTRSGWEIQLCHVARAQTTR